MLCLVTDRRRIGGQPEDVVDQARAAVVAGVDLLHIRERDLEAGDISALVRRIVELARGSNTRVIVNDRVDVAVTSGADGVHLRQDSIPTAAARQLAPRPFLIGRSVHGVDETRAACDADYLVAGTVYRSNSKPKPARMLGVDGLAEIVRATRAPVLAIGGITIERLAAVAAAGAAGVAAIGLFATKDRAAMQAIVEAARRCESDLTPG